MSHMKEQNKTPEKEFTKRKTSNILDAEFKTLVIRMLNELKGRVDELRENFNKEIKNKNGDGKLNREPVRNEEHYLR